MEHVFSGERQRLEAALDDIKNSKINPRKCPFVIDFGGSKVGVTYNKFPTLTATRCMNRSYWATELQRRFLPEELQAAQGSDAKDYDTSMLSTREYGRMIGNAISVPIFKAIMKEIAKVLND